MEDHHTLTIKAWAEKDRPREKLLEKGRQALTDAELLAILIRSGNKKDTAVELSKKILQKANNNLHELAKFSIGDLMDFNGMGDAKALSIVAALELGRRRKETEQVERAKITSSRDVFIIFQPVFMDLPYEEFWILLLNKANGIIKKVFISRGGVGGTVVDAKIIFKEAVQLLASGVILAHNHPSGNVKPSEADISLTQNLKQAGKIMDIPVVDHIIIGENMYYSFADEDKL